MPKYNIREDNTFRSYLNGIKPPSPEEVRKVIDLINSTKYSEENKTAMLECLGLDDN
jgi:hypothetical protein